MQPVGGKTRRTSFLVVALLATAAGGEACSSSGGTAEPTGTTSQAVTASQLAHGRNVWLKATFGGEQFFSLVLPQALGLDLGFGQVLTTPRAQRFAQWGVVNDPDCTDGNASTGGLDICPPDVDPADPDAPFEGAPSGVVGIRLYPNPTGNDPPMLAGVSCAGCHAGLNPQNPPADPSRPTWDNIALTTGNQYIQIGKIFGANLPQTDPRWQVFHTWAPGTVDTTAIESDGINNPGIITQFYDFPDRPYFTVHQGGVLLNAYGVTGGQAHRAGQGGEDDVGCELAATRVYFNIGMCAAECMLPHLTNGPGGMQTPIDLAACGAACPYLPAQQADVADECAFINDAASTPPPRLLSTPGGSRYVDVRAARRGEDVFERSCASCHSNGNQPPHNVWSDDRMHEASGYNPFIGEPPGDVGTNECRALTTNWMAGHIWAAFSSDEKKAEGPGFYRDVPLLGVWATAPFLHNNRLGAYSGDPSVAGRIAAFENAYDQLVNPWTRDELGSVQVTTVAITLPGIPVPLPAATPVGAFANLDQTTGQLLCDDFVENGGHYFGAFLSDSEKNDLREFLKTL